MISSMIDPNVEKTILGIVEENQFRDNPCFYLYDKDDIRNKLALLWQRPPQVSLYYAIKANSNLELLDFISSFGTLDGFEIASSGELDKSLKFYAPKNVIYTGPGKTAFELEHAIDAGIRLLNLESIVEAARIEEISSSLGKTQDVLVRVNTDYYLDGAITNMAGESSKMGIDEGVILKVLSEIRQMDHLNVRGIHVFSASGVLNPEDLTNYVEYVFGMVTRIEKETHQELEIIDFGGGFGIDYSRKDKKFDTERYFQELGRLVSGYGLGEKELILELGRYIVGESGYYVTEIIDIKESKGKKHIVAAGGVNHLRLPSATGINQPVHIIPRNKAHILVSQPCVDNETVDISGPLCFKEDKLAKRVKIPHAEIGDLVVVRKAGAYGYSASTLEQLSHPYPPEYVISCSER